MLVMLGLMAGLVTTLAGMGGGMLLTLALAAWWGDPLRAIVVATPALLVGNAHRLLLFRQHVQWRLALPFVGAAHPGIQLFLRESPSATVRRRVLAGELDLGIVSDPAGAERWIEEDLILVAAPALDPWQAPHLTFPRSANHRELLERHYPDVTIAMELNSLVAVKAHVAAGMGVALLSTTSVARDLAEGRLVQVDDPKTPIRRTLYVLHAGLERLSLAARALREALVAR